MPAQNDLFTKINNYSIGNLIIAFVGLSGLFVSYPPKSNIFSDKGTERRSTELHDGVVESSKSKGTRTEPRGKSRKHHNRAAASTGIKVTNHGVYKSKFSQK